MAAPLAAVHRRACWAADGSHMAAPSRQSDGLRLLDMAPSRHAGCAVPTEAGDPGLTSSARFGSAGGALRAEPPPAVEVALSQTAVCAAAHPGGDYLVAGCRGGRLAVVASP